MSDRDLDVPGSQDDCGPKDRPDGDRLKHAGLLSPSDKPAMDETPDGEVPGTLDSRG